MHIDYNPRHDPDTSLTTMSTTGRPSDCRAGVILEFLLKFWWGYTLLILQSVRAGRLTQQQAPSSRLCQGRHRGFLQAPTTPESLEAMSQLRPCTLTQSAPGVRL